MKQGRVFNIRRLSPFPILLILILFSLSYSAELPAEPRADTAETNAANIADDFVIDGDWICVDLGSFLPHAINNSTHIAGDIIPNKGGPFAGVWKQGFIEKLDGMVVTARSSAQAINDEGQVVGYQKGRYGDNRERAVLWDNDKMLELGTLGGIESRALAINNSGYVVGWVKTADRYRNAFIWRSGTMEYLGVLTSAIAINRDDQILGTLNGGNWVLWDNGTIQKLEPGDQASTPVGARMELRENTTGNNKPTMSKPIKSTLTSTCLNDSGQVAGYTRDSAFLWNNGELQYIDPSEAGRFTPVGMNKHGVLSGRIGNKAAVWNKGKVIELSRYFANLRGWLVTEARGINDYGQIVVFATNGRAGGSRAYLLTPKSKIPILITGKDYSEMEMDNPKPPKAPRPPTDTTAGKGSQSEKERAAVQPLRQNRY